jgi:hypothetical protein
MEVCLVLNADDTPVFINNSSETSEVASSCCDKLKIELQKTVTELRWAQKIIELLQEEMNLKHAHSDRKYRLMLLASQREFTTIGTQKKEPDVGFSQYL